uniref:Ubiquitin-like domain-containing protein n=1 Tax=Noctiluca scintillans TaxID=2966 RepID=A0A7S1FIS2_NOCSC
MACLDSVTGSLKMQFNPVGEEGFELDLQPEMDIRDVKQLASEMCNVLPEHMRVLYKDRQLRNEEIVAECGLDGDEPLKILYTAGHAAMVGGSRPESRVQGNPFTTPVRGIPGSKGARSSRVTGRLGGNGLIRKYGILMKRQEFREKATQMGFRKYS